MPYIPANGTSLWANDRGTGIPIVFSHSLFFDSSMFAHQQAAFGAGYRFISYDHRGQGQSAPSEKLDMDTLADDAAALLHALATGPVHFVGNSLGGFVALRLAARRPELLRSVTILGSSAEAEHRTAEFAPLVDALRLDGAAPVIGPLMHIMFGDTFLADPARDTERTYWRHKMTALPTTIAEAAKAVVFRTAILDELVGLRVPLLAIAGAEDHAYGPAEAENAARAAGGRAVTVARAGHSVALEQPGEVNDLLAAHWRQADQARAA
jgi:3-oxoadipate enol-lactonase